MLICLAASGLSWGMWDLCCIVWDCSLWCGCEILIPQPGMEPPSPALQGGFLTTGPPGKSHLYFISAGSQFVTVVTKLWMQCMRLMNEMPKILFLFSDIQFYSLWHWGVVCGSKAIDVGLSRESGDGDSDWRVTTWKHGWITWLGYAAGGELWDLGGFQRENPEDNEWAYLDRRRSRMSCNIDHRYFAG